MKSTIKNSVWGFIAANRRSAPIEFVRRASRFFENAWHNESTDQKRNGELFVLDRLRGAGMRIVVDAGANRGEWSWAALESWPACQVHAFEVAPRTYESLAAALAPRFGERFLPRCEGLSQSVGTATMYYHPEDDRLTSDMVRHRGDAVPFEARLTSLDDFCDRQSIEKIDFLKIDVEGAEYKVMQGARRLIGQRAISCIQFEYGAFSIQTRILLRDYFDLLQDGYFIGKIFPNYVDFGDYDWRSENFRFSNYLCVSRDRPDLVALVNGTVPAVR